MATYLILNICVLVVVIILVGGLRRKPSKPLLATLFVLLVLTTIFDNIIVGMDIVNYSSQKILGIYIGVAPIEDFMYALLAAILIPALWNKLGHTNV